MADPGWYPDPQDATALQYFDGQRWTGDRRPAVVPTPPSQPPQQQPSSQPSQPTQALPTVPPNWQPAQVPPQPQWGGQPPQQWTGAPAPAAAPPPRRTGKKLLIGGGVVVVLVAAGLGAWQLVSGNDKPTLTYQGKQIADPGQVLQTAETTFAATVASRHGAKNGDSRCYFTQPRKTPSGQKKSDVDNSLLCGPVLFVDGDDSKPYLTIALQASTTGSKATLTPAGSVPSTDNVAVPDSSKLVRPDGKSAPSGADGLKVPLPPPAAAGVLTTAPLGETTPPPGLTGAQLIGKNESVTVTAAGIVDRYGSGNDARSAPDGQQLLAFHITTADGDIGSPPASGGLTVAVTGAQPRKVPTLSDPDDYVVIALPKSSTASLVLDDGGFKQTLSLPDGKAGAGDILVLARKHRFVTIGKTASVPIHLSNGSNSANVTYRTTFASAALDFWVPRHANQHPTSARDALLSVDIDYTDPTNSGTFGWDPQLLKLRLPNGTVVAARNIAAANRIFNVFEVPAGFTTGTLQVTGSEKVQGISLTVTRAASFTISLPAG